MKRTIFIGLVGLFVSSVFASCGGEDLGECPANSEAQQAIGRKVVVSRCQICHASDLGGAARQDAPDDLNFDDLATVHDEGESMYGEAKDGEMPPSPYQGLSDSELESMRVWLACGAPDVAVK